MDGTPFKTAEWRYIDTGDADGFTNMACDEAILRAYGDGLAPPTLRLYSWRPPGLSLGYFQKVEEVDLDACRRLGVDVVRRTTGGRAILHDKEITYSIVVEEDNPLVSGNVVESYRKISLALVAGLRLLGLDAQLAPEVPPSAVYHGSDANGGIPGGALGSSACFDAPSSYELTVDGRKLVGSAQTRSQGLLLQHGSLLLDFDAGRLVQVLRLPEEDRESLRQKMEARAISVRQALGRVPARGEVVRALVDGFASEFRISLAEGELTPAERAAMGRLVEEKYRSREWNHRR